MRMESIRIETCVVGDYQRRKLLVGNRGSEIVVGTHCQVLLPDVCFLCCDNEKIK